MIKIGSYTLDSRIVLAPMAGVTDQPFRKLCRQYGAALTPSEMVSSNIRLWHSDKSRLRRLHDGEQNPRVVQIAGSDPELMAQAAQLNVDTGAQIIDINMGCPAKKVLKKSAGSALLKYPALVNDILDAVVQAVSVPVTLKIRTGWDQDHRNGVEIARLAEDCGIQSIAVHGRTRACAFKGKAEYDTIAAIKAAVSIPVFANGDITTPQKAKEILAYTNVDGLMIGRAAQGQPWIFREISHFLDTGRELPAISLQEIRAVMTTHLQSLHDFYGPGKGVLIARKHVAWYLQNLTLSLNSMQAVDGSPGITLRQAFNQLQTPVSQLENLDIIFNTLNLKEENQTVKELAA